MWDYFSSYGHDILGGILASAAYAAIVWAISFRSNYVFRRIVFPGTGIVEKQNYYLVYGQFVLEHPSSNFPYKKTEQSGRLPTGIRISISAPVSKCEVRGSTYLINSLNKIKKLTPVLVSDVDIGSRNDVSYLAIGAPGSNYKSSDTVQQLDSIRKKLLTDFFDHQIIPGCTLTNNCEYGVILRMTTPDGDSISRILCSGLGEWGSSGSARYLAVHWRTIAKLAGGWMAIFLPIKIPDFIGFIRVHPGDDSSAELIALYTVHKSSNLIRIFPKKK